MGVSRVWIRCCGKFTGFSFLNNTDGVSTLFELQSPRGFAVQVRLREVGSGFGCSVSSVWGPRIISPGMLNERCTPIA